MGVIDYAPYFVITTLLMTLNPLLVKLSTNANGKLLYKVPTAVLCTEVIKVVLSGTAASLQPPSTRTVSWRVAIKFMIPGLLYFCANNLTYFVLTMMDATTFQITSQLKIIFTGLLFRFYLKRRLQMHQYAAIVLVTCGTAVSQIPDGHQCDSSIEAASAQRASTLGGILLNTAVCFASALGGIVNEKLLKETMADSIHWQNVQLYAWGVLINLAMVLSSARSLDPFVGFDWWTVAVVVNNAVNGLAVSALLKYSDNIIRVFAHAFAICLTMVANIFLFDIEPTPQNFLAVVIIVVSMALYNILYEAHGSELVVAIQGANRIPAQQPTEACSATPTGMARAADSEKFRRESDSLRSGEAKEEMAKGELDIDVSPTLMRQEEGDRSTHAGFSMRHMSYSQLEAVEQARHGRTLGAHGLHGAAAPLRPDD